MARYSRHQLIKRLQTGLPRGAPFDLATLNRLGVSTKLASQYVSSGWLARLASGVYAFPNDDLNLHATLKFLQQRISGLHVGGKSALAWQGIRHNLRRSEQLVLWGDVRATLPDWFTDRFPARYVHARLFDADTLPQTLATPPGLPEGVQVAIPERAVLELLYDVGVREGLEEAHSLFEGLRPPRTDVLGKLLTGCTSIKTVRLFLTWARQTHLVDVDALLANFPLATGSDRRWMSRLSDGTLLVLKPHG